MSDGALKAAAAAQRGRATQGAVAEDDAERAAKVRRNAWLLAAVAASVYLGYIAWMAFRAAGG